MELKQIEFFIAACECGSLSKAAEALYTSQPNVSKVIRGFENELGKELFERTSKGLRLTDYGKTVHEYAVTILKNASLITEEEMNIKDKMFSISTYQSHVMSHLLTKIHDRNPDITIEYFQGTVEEITENVSHGISEIGILFISQKQIKAFRHIISHKNLCFNEIAKRKACIFVGPEHPMYNSGSVTADQLRELKFVGGVNDFFSIEHHLNEINVGILPNQIKMTKIHTNSEHLTDDMLLETDLAVLGIDVSYSEADDRGIHSLKIEGEDADLTLGYVMESDNTMSDTAHELIADLTELFQ